MTSSKPTKTDFAPYRDLLGRRVKDKITGIEGICEAIAFDLYGCIQGTICPKADADNKWVEGRWVDVHRIAPVEDDRVMKPVDPYTNDFVSKSLQRLGQKVRDRITGFTGTLASIQFDLYGRVIGAMSPSVDKDGKHVDGRAMDLNRMETVDEAYAMPPPEFAKSVEPKYGKTPATHAHGPAEVRASTSARSRD